MSSIFTKNKILRFAIVGGLGFCVDGGLLVVLTNCKFGVFTARLISFFAAVSVTWILNRFWTFQAVPQMKIHNEYFSYVSTQVAGTLINLSIFFILIKIQPVLSEAPLIPLATGAFFSMVFTYTFSKKLIFKG